MVYAIRYIGEDDWNRDVFETISPNVFLKRYPGEDIFYVAGSFYGEPEYPIDLSKAEIVVVQDKE